jgi:hypothetical protein
MKEAASIIVVGMMLLLVTFSTIWLITAVTLVGF